MTALSKKRKRLKVKAIYEGFRFKNLEPKRLQLEEDKKEFIAILNKKLKI